MHMESCLQLTYSFYCLCTLVFTPIPYVLAHFLSVSLFPSSSSPELSVIMPLGEILPTNKPLTCFSWEPGERISRDTEREKERKGWDFLSACLDGHATVLFMPA